VSDILGKELEIQTDRNTTESRLTNHDVIKNSQMETRIIKYPVG
jgi:hypothetical protein